jgi:hypothetical protein
MIRRLSFIGLVLLGIALLLAATIGVNGIVAILVALGVIDKPVTNFAVLGTVMIVTVWGGLLLLIGGAVLMSTQGIARRGARLFLSGLILLVVGSGPLLAVGAAASLGFTADPNPNLVLLGILAFTTFTPAVLLVLGGAIVFAVGKLRRA